MKKREQKYVASIRRKILKRLGYEKSVSYYDNEEAFNRYTSIVHQTENFAKELLDPNSEFRWFEFNEENEDIFVDMGIKLINRTSKHHKIYNRISKSSSNIDFRIFVKDFENIALDNICEKNPRLKKITSERFRALNAAVTNVVMLYNIQNYIETVIVLKNINNSVLRDINEARCDLYDAGYDIPISFYIEKYIDFVDHIVTASFYLINFRRSIHNYYISTIGIGEFFDKLIEGAKEIKEQVTNVLHEFNSNNINTSNMETIHDTYCNNKIIKFSYYLKRKSVYKELEETMKCLCEEIEKNPKKFDFETSYERYRYKFNSIQDDSEKGAIRKAKLMVTEGKRVIGYSKKIESIRNLMIYARDNYQNEFLDGGCFSFQALFREIYVIKTKSPVFKRTANTILREFEFAKLFKKLGKAYTDKEKNLLEQKIRFLDLKFMRGLMVSFDLAPYYAKYCELKRIMWDTFLLCYGLIDDGYICQVINYIGDSFINLLLSKGKECL